VPPEDPPDFTAYATTAWPRLVRIAHMLTGDFHEAEDLVQTTLVKVHARWRHLTRTETDVYVRRALVNNNLSRIRKRRVVHLLMPFLAEPGSRTDAGTDAGHGAAVERRVLLHQALDTLSARQRAVMILRYYDDLSDQDIAKVLDCSLGTVKTHARRGLTALRAHPALADSEFLGAHR
jgi:RNA polymerase sigma-70 factor (sigma-E family)